MIGDNPLLRSVCEAESPEDVEVIYYRAIKQDSVSEHLLTTIFGTWLERYPDVSSLLIGYPVLRMRSTTTRRSCECSDSDASIREKDVAATSVAPRPKKAKSKKICPKKKQSKKVQSKKVDSKKIASKKVDSKKMVSKKVDSKKKVETKKGRQGSGRQRAASKSPKKVKPKTPRRYVSEPNAAEQLKINICRIIVNMSGVGNIVTTTGSKEDNLQPALESEKSVDDAKTAEAEPAVDYETTEIDAVLSEPKVGTNMGVETAAPYRGIDCEKTEICHETAEYAFASKVDSDTAEHEGGGLVYEKAEMNVETIKFEVATKIGDDTARELDYEKNVDDDQTTTKREDVTPESEKGLDYKKSEICDETSEPKEPTEMGNEIAEHERGLDYEKTEICDKAEKTEDTTRVDHETAKRETGLHDGKTETDDAAAEPEGVTEMGDEPAKPEAGLDYKEAEIGVETTESAATLDYEKAETRKITCRCMDEYLKSKIDAKSAVPEVTEVTPSVAVRYEKAQISYQTTELELVVDYEKIEILDEKSLPGEAIHYEKVPVGDETAKPKESLQYEKPQIDDETIEPEEAAEHDSVQVVDKTTPPEEETDYEQIEIGNETIEPEEAIDEEQAQTDDETAEPESGICDETSEPEEDTEDGKTETGDEALQPEEGIDYVKAEICDETSEPEEDIDYVKAEICDETSEPEEDIEEEKTEFGDEAQELDECIDYIAEICDAISEPEEDTDVGDEAPEPEEGTDYAEVGICDETSEPEEETEEEKTEIIDEVQEFEEDIDNVKPEICDETSELEEDTENEKTDIGDEGPEPDEGVEYTQAGICDVTPEPEEGMDSEISKICDTTSVPEDAITAESDSLVDSEATEIDDETIESDSVVDSEITETSDETSQFVCDCMDRYEKAETGDGDATSQLENYDEIDADTLRSQESELEVDSEKSESGDEATEFEPAASIGDDGRLEAEDYEEFEAEAQSTESEIDLTQDSNRSSTSFGYYSCDDEVVCCDPYHFLLNDASTSISTCACGTTGSVESKLSEAESASATIEESEISTAPSEITTSRSSKESVSPDSIQRESEESTPPPEMTPAKPFRSVSSEASKESSIQSEKYDCSCSFGVMSKTPSAQSPDRVFDTAASDSVKRESEISTPPSEITSAKSSKRSVSSEASKESSIQSEKYNCSCATDIMSKRSSASHSSDRVSETVLVKGKSEVPTSCPEITSVRSSSRSVSPDSVKRGSETATPSEITSTKTSRRSVLSDSSKQTSQSGKCVCWFDLVSETASDSVKRESEISTTPTIYSEKCDCLGALSVIRETSSVQSSNKVYDTIASDSVKRESEISTPSREITSAKSSRRSVSSEVSTKSSMRTEKHDCSCGLAVITKTFSVQSPDAAVTDTVKKQSEKSTPCPEITSQRSSRRSVSSDAFIEAPMQFETFSCSSDPYHFLLKDASTSISNCNCMMAGLVESKTSEGDAGSATIELMSVQSEISAPSEITSARSFKKSAPQDVLQEAPIQPKKCDCTYDLGIISKMPNAQLTSVAANKSPDSFVDEVASDSIRRKSSLTAAETVLKLSSQLPDKRSSIDSKGERRRLHSSDLGDISSNKIDQVEISKSLDKICDIDSLNKESLQVSEETPTLPEVVPDVEALDSSQLLEPPTSPEVVSADELIDSANGRYLQLFEETVTPPEVSSTEAIESVKSQPSQLLGETPIAPKEVPYGDLTDSNKRGFPLLPEELSKSPEGAFDAGADDLVKLQSSPLPKEGSLKKSISSVSSKEKASGQHKICECSCDLGSVCIIKPMADTLKKVTPEPPQATSTSSKEVYDAEPADSVKVEETSTTPEHMPDVEAIEDIFDSYSEAVNSVEREPAKLPEESATSPEEIVDTEAADEIKIGTSELSISSAALKESPAEKCDCTCDIGSVCLTPVADSVKNESLQFGELVPMPSEKTSYGGPPDSSPFDDAETLPEGHTETADEMKPFADDAPTSLEGGAENPDATKIEFSQPADTTSTRPEGVFDTELAVKTSTIPEGDTGTSDSIKIISLQLDDEASASPKGDTEATDIKKVESSQFAEEALASPEGDTETPSSGQRDPSPLPEVISLPTEIMSASAAKPIERSISKVVGLLEGSTQRQKCDCSCDLGSICIIHNATLPEKTTTDPVIEPPVQVPEVRLVERSSFSSGSEKSLSDYDDCPCSCDVGFICIAPVFVISESAARLTLHLSDGYISSSDSDKSSEDCPCYNDIGPLPVAERVKEEFPHAPPVGTEKVADIEDGDPVMQIATQLAETSTSPDAAQNNDNKECVCPNNCHINCEKVKRLSSQLSEARSTEKSSTAPKGCDPRCMPPKILLYPVADPGKRMSLQLSEQTSKPPDRLSDVGAADSIKRQSLQLLETTPSSPKRVSDNKAGALEKRESLHLLQAAPASSEMQPLQVPETTSASPKGVYGNEAAASEKSESLQLPAASTSSERVSFPETSDYLQLPGITPITPDRVSFNQAALPGRRDFSHLPESVQVLLPETKPTESTQIPVSPSEMLEASTSSGSSEGTVSLPGKSSPPVGCNKCKTPKELLYPAAYRKLLKETENGEYDFPGPGGVTITCDEPEKFPTPIPYSQILDESVQQEYDYVEIIKPPLPIKRKSDDNETLKVKYDADDKKQDDQNANDQN